MDFIREFEGRFGDTFWELLAVTGSLLGVLGVVPGASGSGQILCIRPSVRNVFFLESILEQRNGILVEETRKKTSRKVILR